MTQENIDRFFKRNDYDSLKAFVHACNEYDDPYCFLVSVVDDEWEYGYGDYTFRYGSFEDFLTYCREDVRKWGNPEDIEHLVLEVEFSDGIEDERIEIDEI